MPRVPFVAARNSYNMDQMISMKEIADITGLSYWYIRALASGLEKTKVVFPESYTKLGRRPLWLRHEIEKWNTERNRKWT